VGNLEDDCFVIHLIVQLYYIVFHLFITEEWTEQYTTQLFTMGQSCGAKTRTASVSMTCDPEGTPVFSSSTEIEVPSDSIVEVSQSAAARSGSVSVSVSVT
jgi:hypothetical protein